MKLRSKSTKLATPNPEKIQGRPRKPKKETSSSSEIQSTPFDISGSDIKEERMADPNDLPMWSARQTAPPALPPPIRKPDVTADTFEVKPQFIHMVRENMFDGRSGNAFEHIEQFDELCSLFKQKDVNPDAIKLRLFPYSLSGDARDWLKSQPSDSITTYTDLRNKFINRYFPPVKVARLKAEINSFAQKYDESLHEAWARLKKMLRDCPQHGLGIGPIVQLFYQGIDDRTRALLDSSAGGVFLYKTPNEAYQLLEDMAMHTSEWSSSSRNAPTRKIVASVYDEEKESDVTLASLANQFKRFDREINKLTSTVVAMQVGCETCKGPHLTKDCDINDRPIIAEAQANYMGYFRKGDVGFEDFPVAETRGNQIFNNFQRGGVPGSNNYQNSNTGYQKPYYQKQNPQNPPGFYNIINRNQNPQPQRNFQQQPVQQQPIQPQLPVQPKPEPNQSLEEMLRGYMVKEEENKTLLKQENDLLKQQMRNHQASIQNLERDMSRIAQLLSERPPGTLPSNTQVNPNIGPTRNVNTQVNTNNDPNHDQAGNQNQNANTPRVSFKKEPQVFNYSQVNVISSSKGYDGVNSVCTSECKDDEEEVDEEIEMEVLNQVEEKVQVESSATSCEDGGIRISDITPEYGLYLMSVMSGNSSSANVHKLETSKSRESEVEKGVKFSPPLQTYKPPIPDQMAIRSAKLKERDCKSLNDNDICINVPLVDVLAGKDLIAKKGDHENASTTFLKAECEVNVKKKEMSPKLGDPGPCLIPCHLNGTDVMSLADSGASINLMPYSLYLRLNLGDIKPTTTDIRLIDRSVCSPIGICEDVVVKIGELDFLADFVIVDLEEDKDVPLVLGRPFLATASALIDIKTGNLTLRNKGKQMSFQTRQTVKPPPTPASPENVIFSTKTGNSKPDKCGGRVKEKPVRNSEDSIVDKSMRKPYGRVQKSMSEMDEQLRHRLVSNLSRKEKEKLRELIEESIQQKETSSHFTLRTSEFRISKMRSLYVYNHFLIKLDDILPREIVLDIKERCDKIRKEERQNLNEINYARGKSRMAKKRRARQLEKCVKCGKNEHYGQCPKNQTDSNYEYVTLCREGPLKCMEENLLNQRGYVYKAMGRELGRLQYEASLRGFTLL